MDSLRSEEVKRQKSAILKQFGLSEKTDPKTVSNKIKRKLQLLGRYSNFTLIDKIFGGQLVSTIVCEQCHNSSQIYEPFLDLSLPLVDEKPQRPVKNKNPDLNDIDDDDSKHVSCFGGFRKKKETLDQEEPSKKKMSKAERKKAKANARKAKKMDSIEKDLPEANEAEEESKESKDLESKDKDSKDLESKGDDKPSEMGEECKIQKELEENEKKVIWTPHKLDMKKVTNKFEILQKDGQKKPERVLDGSEEDDEDGFSPDEDDDWEWDYSEEQKDDSSKKDVDEVTSDYIEIDAAPLSASDAKPKVSLNPLPPERLVVRSSEEREKSSDAGLDEDPDNSETGSHGDIEDNLDESKQSVGISINDTSGLLRNLKPFQPDPQRLDPHMEALCRKVRKLSVSMADPNVDSLDAASKEYDISDNEKDVDDEKHQLRLKNDWIARSLTSIAPRYQSQPGVECSIYSCLGKLKDAQWTFFQVFFSSRNI